MCATAPVAQNGEKGDEEGKKERRRRRRKIQIWKWSLGLQTDRKFCLTDDGCSGRGVAAVIKQFTAPDAQLGDTYWTSLCAAHKPPERGSTEREGNRQTEGEGKRVGDTREEHGKDHLVNRCGSVSGFPPTSNTLTMNILGFK